jgi:hypothetical protein
MADIAEIQLEIKAIKFALGSFARFTDEQQRKDYLRSQFDTVQNLTTYFSFSELELKDTLNKEQDTLSKQQDTLSKQQDALNKQQDLKRLLLERNRLLALQRGGVFTCECLNLQ